MLLLLLSNRIVNWKHHYAICVTTFSISQRQHSEFGLQFTVSPATKQSFCHFANVKSDNENSITLLRLLLCVCV